MEFADGGNLIQKMQEKLNEEQILIILAQILEALQYIHSKSIVHQDLKPENILFLKNGQLKIADFGFAKYVQKSFFLGTP
jgi:serine/threonine protein kinase